MDIAACTVKTHYHMVSHGNENNGTNKGRP